MPWRGHIMLLQLGSEHSGVAVRSTQCCQRRVETTTTTTTTTTTHPEDGPYPVGEHGLRCGLARHW